MAYLRTLFKKEKIVGNWREIRYTGHTPYHSFCVGKCEWVRRKVFISGERGFLWLSQIHLMTRQKKY